jgi:hypothetical protein
MSDSKYEYPLYKYYYKFDLNHILNLSKIQNIHNNLTNKKPEKMIKPVRKTCINPNNKNILLDKWDYLFIEDNPDDNNELNLITDYFSMHERIKASFIHNISPIEYYNKNYDEILEKLDITTEDIEEKKLQPVQIFMFDNYMRNHLKFANNFKISVILRVLDIFKPTKWLDISAGWGDRLISAILYPTVKRYFSTDPNIALQPCYNNIIKSFNVNPKHYKIKTDGFEKIKLHDYDYDFVFSSPPFFDIELYSNNENDSVTKYKSLEKWYYDFLLCSIIKCCKHLKTNSFFVLNMIINCESNNKYSNRKLFEDMKQINNLKYCGSIYYYNSYTFKPRELQVFKKIGDVKFLDKTLDEKYKDIN